MSGRRGREIPVKRIELQSVRTLLGPDWPDGGAFTRGVGGEGAGENQASKHEPAKRQAPGSDLPESAVDPGRFRRSATLSIMLLPSSSLPTPDSPERDGR